LVEHSNDRTPRSSQFKGKTILKGKWKGKEIEYLEREIIIRYKSAVVKQLADPMNRRRMKVELLRELPQGFKVINDLDRFGRLIIEVGDSEDLFSLIEGIERNPSVEYAEPNIVHHIAQTIPNEYGSLSQLVSGQWGLAGINAPLGWDQTVGSTNVLLSIIDTGIPMPARSPAVIYRWHNPEFVDYLYTTDPNGEGAADNGYIYEGAPFRLFASTTPGTTTFFRWYNPSLNQHFYTTDPDGENVKDSGYISEGDIGNIAPEKISGTVGLHRWYHHELNTHLYTTDPGGENPPASGYTYEGIAGFVNGAPTNILSHPDISQNNRVVLGTNRLNGSNFPLDDSGHGTHVCGIASADTNNGIGVAGVCWNCTVHVVKVFDAIGNTSSSVFYEAVVEAVDLGVLIGKRVVINYSAGSTAVSNTDRDAVEYAHDRNVLIVAAAGNDSNRNPPTPMIAPVRSPAALSIEFDNVIAVGSVDRANNISSSSNAGPEVNVVAPGVNIRSTVPNYVTTLNPTGASYINMNGTSMAAPHVTGLAALILSVSPSLSPLRVRQIIEETAVDLGPAGRDDTFGHGIISCQKSLAVFQPNVIFRWYNPELDDHFYTTDPSGENAPASGYLSEGAPFRLFSPGIAGTTTFFRWYNPELDDHFYTTDPSGENAPASGYISEGDIGNIATINISGTVGLHRWYNPELDDHFYTTDPSGENAPATGYLSEGMVGFVVPM
jgi:subtilisin family serine protease